MKRIAVTMLTLVMMLGLLVGCGGGSKTQTPDNGPQPQGSDSSAVSKETLTIAVSTEPTSLNVGETNLVYDIEVWQMIYSRLIRYDADMRFENDLVESYENLSDTEWKFTLRQGIKFSDGSALTSEDVSASLWAIHDSAAVAAYAAWLDEVEIVDDYNFIIHTDGPSARMLMDLAQSCFIVPSELLESGYNFNEAPVGSGPYVLTEWVKGDHLSFIANEDYYISENVPAIKNVTYRIIPEGVSRTIALQNGEVDYLYDVQASDVETLRADSNVEVFSDVCASPFYLCYNLDKPIMQEINVRKAIAMGINRENASLVATGGLAEPLYSGFAMGLLGSSDEKAVRYDPDTAKELLAGYTAEQLTFNIVTKEEVFRVALESVQADMNEIGVTLKITMVDNATYTNLASSGDYDMVVGKVTGVNQLATLQSSMQTGAPYGQCHLSDAFVDESLEKALTIVDDAQRAEVIKSVIDYCDENCYRIGIYQLCNTRAYNASLRGFECNMTGYDRFEKLTWN